MKTEGEVENNKLLTGIFFPSCHLCPHPCFLFCFQVKCFNFNQACAEIQHKSIFRAQSNSYSRKIDLISLRAGFRIENVPVFLLRQRPEQYVKLLHSVMSEAFPVCVLIRRHTDEPKSPFPTPVPSQAPPHSFLTQISCSKSCPHFFPFTFLVFTAQFTPALQ